MSESARERGRGGRGGRRVPVLPVLTVCGLRVSMPTAVEQYPVPSHALRASSAALLLTKISGVGFLLAIYNARYTLHPNSER